MTGCTLCPRQCGADRSRTKGVCGVKDEILVGAIVIHRGEEPPLVRDAGSGAIFFCGCPMKCSYCQNHQISRLCKGKSLTPRELSDYMLRLQDAGCSNINLVSPTHYSNQIFQAMDEALRQGLNLPIVVNSGGYETQECMEIWMDHARIFLMDLKYGDNHMGKTLSSVPDYWDRACEAIGLIHQKTGPLEVDQEGRAVKGLMVRHLVLPGMLSNPFSVLEFLSELSIHIPLSLMSQYNPVFYQGEVPDMKRTLTGEEYQVVVEKAMDLGFSTIYAQELDSNNTYNPDFDSASPFQDLVKFL